MWRAETRSLAAVAVAAVLSAAPARPEGAGDPWEKIRFLEGSWTGVAEGRFGNGTVTSSYSFVLDQSYLRGENRTIYPPQERNPEGEVHEEWSFFSYDRKRQALILRQFHNEKIINQFVLNPHESSGDVLVFDSESIENFQDGWRAREKYRLISSDEFVEEFSLAAPGKEWQLFIRSQFRRTDR